MISLFGRLKKQEPPSETIESSTHTLYCESFDRQALWDPKTIDVIISNFPQGYVDEAMLFLLVTECVANCVLHGQAKQITITIKKRRDTLLLSIKQTPKMLGRVAVVINLARNGEIEKSTTKLPGGLGFPIILRLVRKMTISSDLTTLRLWLRSKKD